MIKLFTILFYSLLSLPLLAAAGDVDVQAMHWNELTIVAQVRIVAGLTFMTLLATLAVVLFRSVWVRNSYAGVDGIVDDKEVSLFMSHVLAFALLEIFFFMVLFYNFVHPPEYAFWICGAGFLSPEVVQVLHLLRDKFKVKPTNHHPS